MSKIGGDKGLISLIVANGDLGNANTSYTYFNMSSEDWRYFSVACTNIQATTLTLEASPDPMSVADASKSWVDVTTAMTGAATLAAQGTWIRHFPTPFTRMRIKRVTSNATNSLRLKINRTR
jgi:hypothetical protein